MKPDAVISIGFCVIFVTLAILVGLGKAHSEILAAPITGYLGWLAPGPRGRRASDPIPIDLEETKP